ncbi:MAG TPA: ATP-binding protein [Candidatus Acidoferrales bacterium]|jgi:two-component system phosphate regulon sensor histidine kinase PhoR|nr:ATP-binding protein [Candidatus Acidoferrales bacterium]
MQYSISRRALALATAIVLPQVVLIYTFGALPWVRWLSLAAAVTGVAIAGLWSWSLARRIKGLTGFVNRLLDLTSKPPKLKAGDDELGELVHSLSEVAPQVGELVNQLSTELMRREAILASMTDAVLAVDAGLNVTFCNDAFVRAVGSRSNIEGVPLIRVVRDPGLNQVLKHVVDSGEMVRKRLQPFSPGGLSFDVYAAPLSSSSWRGAIAILHDVTPIERLERAKRDFVANVSHEFRTPLATITGYAETLLDGGLEDHANRRRFVEIIQANGVRLNNIAADLLTLSEIEDGRPGAGAHPISLRQAIGNAIRAIEPAASLMHVNLSADPVPDLFVLGYGIRLEQALLNLIDNAVKFNKEGGDVRVSVLESDSGQIEIRISDTGVGIPPEDLSRIFERFYRVDKARSRQVGGTGLGLSIVKHAIEQMNGAIAVESRLGKGTAFRISLPGFRVPAGEP